MKLKSLLILLIFLNLSCSSSKSFFNKGDVIISNAVEVIDLKMVNDLPLAKVEINGKEYWFLVDTGAATVISKEIFADLNLETAHSGMVGNSQENKQSQDFCVLPEMKIGNLTFKNIGAVALTIENQELKCFGFDGIIGSNLMAKLYWEFDYQNNKIRVSKELASLQSQRSDFIWNFSARGQKTPIVTGKVNDKKYAFTFDTGYGGNLKVANDLSYHQNLTNKENFVTRIGVNAIGLYGASKTDESFAMNTNLSLSETPFSNEIVDSGSSTLVGNAFLKDYVFVIDWFENKIYFKKNKVVTPKKMDGFGFSYLFVDGKAEVISKVQNRDIPINLGDVILSINETDFTKIDSSEICHYFMNKVEKEEKAISIRVKRAEELLTFDLKRQDFLK